MPATAEKVIAEDAPRAVILESLAAANAEARRMLIFDPQGRLSATWGAQHRWINVLLTMLERAE